MQLYTLLQLLVAGNLAVLATAVPTAAAAASDDALLPEINLLTAADREATKLKIEAYFAANNITVNEGFYSGDENDSNKLAKRSIPSECIFEVSRIPAYYYRQIVGIQGTACIGYATNMMCSNSGFWNDPDWTDIQRSVAEQVTKDGFFKTTQVGRWTAAFLNLSKFTTAFSNRETVLFIYGLLWIEKRPQRFYWSRDGDFLQTQRDRC
ncbi:hypothetical protein V8F06_009280 [Rhypophila decipiens]